MVAAYADDLVFYSLTKQGMQAMLEHATSILGECGLSVNQDKCLSIALRSEPKRKYTFVD